MKFDIILAGVGGQGVLSVSAIIASSAMQEGLAVKQSFFNGTAPPESYAFVHTLSSHGALPSWVCRL
jgi:Pyruvate/2-oxoacid:ferredoxin oxidoreductase gamma subunit